MLVPYDLKKKNPGVKQMHDLSPTDGAHKEAVAAHLTAHLFSGHTKTTNNINQDEL
jgi:hypothetical protein